MMNSASRRALYTGVCGNLEKRVFEHKTHKYEGFTCAYNATRLVYFEEYQFVQSAITREKQIKRWSRKKKNWLVEQMNPEWRDLAEDWHPEAQGPSAAALRASARDDNSK